MSSIERENLELLEVLDRNGFRRCDIPACNCGSWHQVYGYIERVREIDDATNDYLRNGETLIRRVERIVADAARWKYARANPALFDHACIKIDMHGEWAFYGPAEMDAEFDAAIAEQEKIEATPAEGLRDAQDCGTN